MNSDTTPDGGGYQPAPGLHPFDTKPNPGSAAAVDRGCTCAVLDNNHGRFAPRPPDGWWITAGCPVHAPSE